MRHFELIEQDIEAYLALHERKDLLRLMTCGSVDDGKSTLIGRLLYDSKLVYEDHIRALERDSARVGKAGKGIDFSLLLDGLRAEREQGITIDVAYRFFSTDKRKFIIADTPGHEQYTRNMVTGGSTADLAIILIDAENGVLTQTKRHSFLASLLRIRHLVVAVNKMDLVAYSEERFDAIRAEYSGFATKLEISDVQFIPISARDGDNVVEPSTSMSWYRGPTLLHHLETVHIASDRNLIDFRFPVQHVIRPDESFRGYAGSIVSGVVRRGDTVMVLPSGKRNRVKRIVRFDGDLEEAFSPMTVVLELEDEVDNVPYTGDSLEAMLVWMGEAPMQSGTEYLLKHTTTTVPAKLADVRYRIDVNTLHRDAADRLALNEIGRVTLELTRPISYDPYANNRQMGCFILIDRDTNGTVGAGMIIDRRRYEDWSDRHKREPKSQNVTEHHSLVTDEERAERAGHRPFTVWLTGLPKSGKAPIAYALERRLFDLGCQATVLAGSNLRRGLSVDLGFAELDRTENIRRAASVAELMNRSGLVVIAAFVTPLAEDRRVAREIVGEARFLEVFVSTSIEEAEARDTEGLYARARRGEIPNFSGVSAPYERPLNPDLSISIADASVETLIDRIVDALRARGALAEKARPTEDEA